MSSLLLPNDNIWELSSSVFLQCLGNSGRSRIFERGIQVQANYGNSMDFFIVAGEYVYAEAVKSAPIRAKRGKNSGIY